MYFGVYLGVFYVVRSVLKGDSGAAKDEEPAEQLKQLPDMSAAGQRAAGVPVPNPLAPAGGSGATWTDALWLLAHGLEAQGCSCAAVPSPAPLRRLRTSKG